MMPLTAFIHRKFIVLNKSNPISRATQAICDNQIGCLLVGDNEGHAIGIVTDRDLVCRGLSKPGSHEVPIDQIMSQHLVAADEGSSLSDVIQLMERYGIRRIPITRQEKNGKKVFSGIVTLDDLIAANQLKSNQISKIIRKQIGRRMSYLKELQTRTSRRSQIKSGAHKEETLHRFYSQLSKFMKIEPDVLPGLTQFILGALVMRITFTGASHFMAQLPTWIQEMLLRLPSGPDRSYSGKRLIQELSKRFQLTNEQSCSLFSHFLLALNDWVGSESLEKLKSQLPQEYHPFFESAVQESLKRAKLKEQDRPFSQANPDPKIDPSLWTSSMIFSDRTHAAELISEKLSHYRGKNPLILGIPRGSVPMAKIITDKLNGELDVVLVHKIGAPDNPEFAIGSVSEFGTLYRSDAVEFYEIPSDYIEKSARREVARLQQRRQSYTPIHPPIDPKDRTVIVVDDGIATGSTMLAAIRAIRAQKPQKIIVASPVASPRTLELLRNEADEIVVLQTPQEFFAIGQFYLNFPQVKDQEVLQILSASREKVPSQVESPSGKKAA